MIKVIFWDFDGVLMDSNPIRDVGFKHVLSGFPKEQVNQLLNFHKANGGLSRYVKFRYFFEEVRKESITEEEILILAQKFSLIMKELLVDSKLLIEETIRFVSTNQNKYKMHITSGSDQEELRFLCEKLGISKLFDSIHGSPKPKKDWIRELINSHSYNNSECLLIGDSLNDWEAAEDNNIYFFAYNGNENLNIKTNIDFELK